MENNLAIALSIIFCLSPVVLTVHLAIEKSKPSHYKKKLGYVYGGLWAIAFLGFGWLFFNL